MSFFQELKHRNVLRVAVAYLAGAWLLIQIAETIFPLFDMSDLATRYVVIVMLVGFVPVLVVAWAFELTPEGLIREEDLDRSRPQTLLFAKRLNRIIMIVLALAVGYFGFDKFVLDPVRDADREEIIADEARSQALAESHGDISIAVLPFVNMSPDVGNEYFADGISEELLNLLTKIQDLRVISRSSAFSYKGKDIDIQTVADRLNVSHILEGSVRKDGNTVRITAQLIDGRSDTHLWSKTYDRELNDVFRIQDEISAEVVEQLELTLFGTPIKTQPVDTLAYTLALRARHLLNQYDSEYLQEVELLLRQALEIDPNYVMALTELARLYVHQGNNGLRPIEEVKTLFHEVIGRANEIEPDNGVVHIFLGSAPLIFEGDIKSGAANTIRAMQLDPTNPFVVQWAQTYAFQIGRFDLVETLGLYIIARDPLCIACQANLGHSYLLTERYDDAETIFDTIALIDSKSFVPAHYLTGMSRLLAGHPAGALTKFQQEENQSFKAVGLLLAKHDLGKKAEFQVEFEKIQQMDDVNYTVAAIHAWVGNTEAAFELLEKGVTEDPRSYVDVYQEPLFRSLHHDPRWIEVLNKTGRSPEQLASIDFDIPLPE